MSPLYYASSNPVASSAFTTLMAMQPLLVQSGIQQANPSQILNATDKRASAIVRDAGNYIKGLTPRDHTILSRLDRGHAFRIEDVVPSFCTLNSALAKGVVSIPDRVSNIDYYDEEASPVTASDVIALTQYPELALPVAADDIHALSYLRGVSHCFGINATTEDLLSAFAQRVEEQLRSASGQLLDRLLFEQEMTLRGVIYAFHGEEISATKVIPAVSGLALLKVMSLIPPPWKENPNCLLSLESLEERYHEKYGANTRPDPFKILRRYSAAYGGIIENVGQLAGMRKRKLLKIKGIGHQSFRRLRLMLEELGLQGCPLLDQHISDFNTGTKNAASTSPSWSEHPNCQLSLKNLKDEYPQFFDRVKINAMREQGLENIGQIAGMTEGRFLKLKHVGRKTLREMRMLLEQLGLQGCPLLDQYISDFHAGKKRNAFASTSWSYHPNCQLSLEDLKKQYPQFFEKVRIHTLRRNGLENIGQVAGMTAERFLRIKYIGRESLRGMRSLLKELGLQGCPLLYQYRKKSGILSH